MTTDSETVWITIDVATETTELETGISGARGGIDIGGSWDTATEKVTQALRKRVPISASLLKQEMNGLLKVLGTLFEEASQHTQGLELDEVELSVEINSEGQISIVGNSASVSSKGAITLKFKRSVSSTSSS